MSIIAAGYDHDHDDFHFKRTANEGLRGPDLQWEDRLPPLEPLWKSVLAGVGTFLFIAIVVFVACAA